MLTKEELQTKMNETYIGNDMVNVVDEVIISGINVVGAKSLENRIYFEITSKSYAYNNIDKIYIDSVPYKYRFFCYGGLNIYYFYVLKKCIFYLEIFF